MSAECQWVGYEQVATAVTYLSYGVRRILVNAQEFCWESMS
jgi:hypothetical protein